MSIGINSNTYPNAVSAYTANKKNLSFEQMQKQVQNPINDTFNNRTKISAELQVLLKDVSNSEK